MTKYFLEVKNRFLILLVTYFSILLVTYLYKEVLLFVIININYTFYYFIFTNVTEIFSVYVDLIIFLSFQITAFYFLYHCFSFFVPAFFQIEYLYSKVFMKIIFCCWILSISLASYVIIPLTWNFFLGFQELITNNSFNIHFEAKLGEYFSFCMSLYYICGFYFQVFILLLLMLNSININSNIKKFRKLYYFGFVVFSTLISPPDIISQLLISLFLIFLYEVVLFLFVFKNYLN